MVTDAIVTSIREVIASFEVHDLTRTKSYISGLVELLDQMPESTAGLLGPQKLVALSQDLNQALSDIGEEALALARLQRVLLVWVEDSSGSLQ
jgi:hypothetical protein